MGAGRRTILDMSNQVTSSQQPSVDARPFVDSIIGEALRRHASDIHVEPTGAGYDVRLRIDGLLQTHSQVESAVGRGIVMRLMVLAQLLTYRLDIPQEGRIAHVRGDGPPLDLRLAIMPTAIGLRAAVRMPAELMQPRTLEELGLPAGVMLGLQRFAAGDAGMLIVTGPAGSGKTTTIYAVLDHIARQSPGLSIITLEDPVERHVGGITQIEVSPHGELTYERALRSILRQDPQVLMLGEIRDAATASLAVQAALSGHRLICTLHAGTVGGAIARLFEMGIEPYQITSSLYGVVAQRLLRRRAAAGGYCGRVPVAELACIDVGLRGAILQRTDAESLQNLLGKQPGYVSMRAIAADMVKESLTDEAEVRRVLGQG
jgi:general secretion pathway protein E